MSAETMQPFAHNGRKPLQNGNGAPRLSRDQLEAERVRQSAFDLARFGGARAVQHRVKQKICPIFGVPLKTDTIHVATTLPQHGEPGADKSWHFAAGSTDGKGGGNGNNDEGQKTGHQKQIPIGNHPERPVQLLTEKGGEGERGSLRGKQHISDDNVVSGARPFEKAPVETHGGEDGKVQPFGAKHVFAEFELPTGGGGGVVAYQVWWSGEFFARKRVSALS